jgi:uncharacterized protein YabN with tetrapyrrole methylase and pyrophosphatase domain
MSDSATGPSTALLELRAIMARLRAPDGCPWDREQTHMSLRSSLIEEAYEVVEAIERGVDADLCEELGDLLLQVVFHAQLAEEEKRFSFTEIAEAISKKLVHRHPHVFGAEHAADAAAVVTRWEDGEGDEWLLGVGWNFRGDAVLASRSEGTETCGVQGDGLDGAETGF